MPTLKEIWSRSASQVVFPHKFFSKALKLLMICLDNWRRESLAYEKRSRETTQVVSSFKLLNFIWWEDGKHVCRTSSILSPSLRSKTLLALLRRENCRFPRIICIFISSHSTASVQYARATQHFEPKKSRLLGRCAWHEFQFAAIREICKHAFPMRLFGGVRRPEFPF